MKHVAFPWNLFPARHVRLFRAVQMQGDAVRQYRLDCADDDLVFLTAEAVELALAFRFTQPLGDNLLGRLRRDASEVARSDVNHNHVIHGGARGDAPRFFQRNLRDRIVNLFDGSLLEINAC